MFFFFSWVFICATSKTSNIYCTQLVGFSWENLKWSHTEHNFVLDEFDIVLKIHATTQRNKPHSIVGGFLSCIYTFIHTYERFTLFVREFTKHAIYMSTSIDFNRFFFISTCLCHIIPPTIASDLLDLNAKYR